MKNVCDVVQDILPLYADNVCSEASRELVEEHLPKCEKCSDTLQKLKGMVYESDILKEKENVLKHNYRSNRNRAFAAGGIIAAVLMVPVVVCLIVNIAAGHALDWFFIVLASLLVVASVTVVPLITAEKRFLYSSLSFLGTLLILLAVCCIYTGGRWFFIAAVAVLMGAATTILPIIADRYFSEGFRKRNKGLLVYCTDTILLLLLFLSISVYIGSAAFLKTAMLISAAPVAGMWILFIIVRYWRVNAFIRAGGFTAFLSAFIVFINPLISYILGEPVVSLMASDYYTNTCIGVSGAAAGIVIMIVGIAGGAVKRAGKKQ